MKTLLLATIAAVGLSAPAFASYLDVMYTASVSIGDGTTANTGYTDGQVLNGEFLLDTSSDTILFSTLGAYAAPANGASQVGVTQARDSAGYALGTSALIPGQINDSLTVTLNPTLPASFPQFPAGSTPDSILLTQLPTLDYTGSGTGSVAIFQTANADGTNQTEVVAYLDAASVTVPEPTSLVLLGTAIAGVIAAARRRV